jgi:hypothetical protein
MAITKLKPKTSVDQFISNAPDAGNTLIKPERKRVMKGHREQITLTMPPDLLAKVENMARSLGQTRAGFINMAVHRAVEKGFSIDGLQTN